MKRDEKTTALLRDAHSLNDKHFRGKGSVSYSENKDGVSIEVKLDKPNVSPTVGFAQPDMVSTQSQDTPDWWGAWIL